MATGKFLSLEQFTFIAVPPESQIHGSLSRLVMIFPLFLASRYSCLKLSWYPGPRDTRSGATRPSDMMQPQNGMSVASRTIGGFAQGNISLHFCVSPLTK